jgi:phage FluMu protein Com
MECGFHGNVTSDTRKLECPICKTINDFWLEDEEPPQNHR